MKAIRIGIVGAGANVQAKHLPNLRQMEGVEIVGVCNRSRKSSERVAREFHIPRIYDRWEDLVSDPQIDAVVIGTWPYLHCPVTIAALDAGKHLLCEARMAMDRKEAKRMLAASNSHKNLVSQLVPSPLTLKVDRTVSDLMRKGFLGKPYALHVLCHQPPSLETRGFFSWRDDPKLSGLNVLTLGIWYESIMRWIGTAKTVFARGKTVVGYKRDNQTGKKRRCLLPDYLEVFWETKSEVQAFFQLSSVAHLARPPEVWLFGTDGTLRYDLLTESLFGGKKGDRELKPIPIPPEAAGRWRVEEEFINAIRGIEPIKLTTFEEGVEYMKFTEAVHRSLKLFSLFLVWTIYLIY